MVRRPVEGLRRAVSAAFVLVAALSCAATAADFPYGRELLLDAAPIRPGKRMPSITIAPNGAAMIGLWCKSVSGRVELSADAIKIEADPLPDALPQWQGNGQCTPERMQADQDMLSALGEVTTWKKQGTALVLIGPRTMKFSPATN